MKLFNKILNDIFKNKQAIKVISGINNLNVNEILEYIRACEISKASYIDIVANPDIVKFIKEKTNLPICVSSIDIISLYESVLAGADIIEIGNFDIFYKQGIMLSSEQIVTMSAQIRSLFPHIDICVTIPHTYTLNQQIKLALKLESIGINMIQTEGNTSKVIYSNLIKNNISQDYLLDSILESSSTLSSVYFLSNAVNIPIIASSGINSITGPIAIAYGASCIGIKSEINSLSDINYMSFRISEIFNSLYLNTLIGSSEQNSFLSSHSYINFDKSLFYNV